MSNNAIQSDLNKARLALNEARWEKYGLLTKAASGGDQKEGRHLPGPISPTAEADKAAVAERIKTARKKEKEAKKRLMETIISSLSPDPKEDYKKLGADYPIVLLPARLETRFLRTSRELLVRIYPDEIAAEAHEPELTEREMQAGRDYWRLAWSPELEKNAWSQIVRQFSAHRSAWIVLATAPKNLNQRPEGQPVFPEVALRIHSWTKPAISQVLPDRWILLAYRSGQEIYRLSTNPVEEPLALTLDPAADEEEIKPSDGPALDTGVAWTVNFDRAVEAGMAIRIPLTEEDLNLGFERLVAVGVKTTLDASQSSARLESLLQGHHYSRGLAFLKQGSPTNNTSLAPSSFPPSDLGGGYSYEIERKDPLAVDGSDGSIFVRALGLPRKVVDHVALADSREQESARAMNAALWPATIGYFLEAMMGLKAEQTLSAREHFVNFVRGRGPYPAFRIGGTPYGLLPVAPLNRSLLLPEASSAEKIITRIVQGHDIWLEGAKKVPKIGLTTDPDRDLLDVLSMDASAQEVRIRAAVGGEFVNQLPAQKGYSIKAWTDQKETIAQALSQSMESLGLPHLPHQNRILEMTFSSKSRIYKHPICSQSLSEEMALTPNYIQDLVDLSTDSDISAARNATSKELLYLMLRQSLLLTFDAEAFAILSKKGEISDPFRSEPEIIDFLGGPPRTAWQRLDYKIPEITGEDNLWRYLQREDGEVSAYRSALRSLQPLPTAELQRLFAETLDVCSHRLDAWATSLAAKRLEELRKTNPQGCYLGGFAFVEDLLPLPEGQTQNRSKGGFVQAPSMVHATAAAVLQSGFLTHSQVGASSFDINLSSRRVRKARFVLDCVRQGQFLGAVLGYNFERGLHDRKMEKLIDPLRRLYPLTGGESNDRTSPSGATSPRNVLDGLALRRAWEAWTKKSGPYPFNLDELPKNPPVGTEEQEQLEALTAESIALDDLVDSVTDLLTAETIYQIVKGNTAAASASLDTMARGARPHDPEILRQPRTGTTLTHRFLMVLGGDVILVDAWRDAPLTPRAKAEPFLNRWAGEVMGDPRIVKCTVNYRLPAQEGTVEKSMIVTLRDLAIRPVDFLFLAGRNDSSSELNQRIAETVLRGAPQAQQIKIDFSAKEGWNRDSTRTFPEILEVARAINNVIASARPLVPRDLTHPASSASRKDADLMGEEALARAKDARDALAHIVIRLDRETRQMEEQGQSEDRAELTKVLKAASLFGPPGIFPVTVDLKTLGDGELLSMAKKASKELDARRINADDMMKNSTGALSDEMKVKQAVDIVKVVFGKDFVFLPRFKPTEPDVLANALDLGLKGLVDPAQTQRDNVLRRWMQQTSRVRRPLERWRKLWLYAQALGAPAARLDVAQLYSQEGDRWAALPFASEENRHASGTLSLVLYRPSILGLFISPPASVPWTGLILDEWTEMIPSTSENTGISFPFDNPGAEAAQVVLIAVPNTDTSTWQLDLLIDIVNDTLDLMKVRLTNAENLEGLSQLLPATYLAANTNQDAICADISKDIVADPIKNGGA